LNFEIYFIEFRNITLRKIAEGYTIYKAEESKANQVVIVGDAKKNKRVPRKIFEPISKMVKTGLYKDEQEVLQRLVHDKAEQKINYYNKKIAEMKQKYEMDFSAFESRICLGTGEEDFEEWDDFTLWEGYVKAYRYWKQYL